MPRMRRIVLPNYPRHVVQRGHNRQVVFVADQDYQRYVDGLRKQQTSTDLPWRFHHSRIISSQSIEEKIKRTATAIPGCSCGAYSSWQALTEVT